MIRRAFNKSFELANSSFFHQFTMVVMVNFVLLYFGYLPSLVISARYLGRANGANIRTINSEMLTKCHEEGIMKISDSDVKAYLSDKWAQDRYAWTDRPIRDGLRAMEIDFCFVLQGINSISEKEGSIKVAGYLQLEWLNEYAIWNDTMPFSCIQRVTKRPETMWLPDVSLTNSADDMFRLMESKGFAVVMDSSGINSYSPGGEISAYCSLDLSLFPFDQQNCSLFFEPWSVSYEQQHFIFSEDPFIILRFKDNEQWQLVSRLARLNNLTYEDARTYHQAEFVLTLKRKAAYYNVNVIIPSFVISIIALVAFTLEEDDVVKLHISFTCLLSYSVFQVMIIGDMPRSSQNTPLLSIYIVLQMALIGMTILLEGVVYVLFANANRKTKWSPKTVFKFAQILSKILRMNEEEINDAAEIYVQRNCHQRPSNMFESARKRRMSADRKERLKVELSKSVRKHEKLHPMESQDVKPDNELSVLVVDDSAGKGLHDPGVPSSNIQGMSTFEMAAKLALSHQWVFIAKVVDRMTLVMYLVSIILTPLVMFLILPAFHNLR